jgi:hypothetical protein
MPVAAGRRRRLVLFAGGIVVLAVLTGLIVYLVVTPGVRGSPKQSSTGTEALPSVPAGARAAARDLISGDDTRVRAALSPALAAQLTGDGIGAPSGTALTLDPKWSQRGDHAAASGTLTSPGHPSAKVLIGFVSNDGQWRVTFVERYP